jgi:large subunit ribosomal protein L29
VEKKMGLVKATDLRTKSEDELKDRLAELRREQFNLRFQKSTGQLAGVAQGRKVRREIAQVLTLINERRRKAAAKAA